jgi:hypothetical protein
MRGQGVWGTSTKGKGDKRDSKKEDKVGEKEEDKGRKEEKKGEKRSILIVSHKTPHLT